MSLEALMRHMNDGGAGLTGEQITTRLYEWFAQMHAVAPETFEPGEIIWHRCPEWATTKGADEPHIFVGYLPEPFEVRGNITDPGDIGSASAAMVMDSRIASMMHGHVATFLMDSRQFSRAKPVR